MHFDITFKNGGTHLPADEMGLPTVYTLVLLATCVFGIFVINLLRAQYKQVRTTKAYHFFSVYSNLRISGTGFLYMAMHR